MVIMNLFKKKIHCHSLREYMEQEGIKKQKDLAKKLRISPTLISHVLNGRKTFGKKTALRISEITGIPVENLIK